MFKIDMMTASECVSLRLSGKLPDKYCVSCEWVTFDLSGRLTLIKAHYYKVVLKKWILGRKLKSLRGAIEPCVRGCGEEESKDMIG